MKKKQNKDYWEERGEISYTYKKEVFYTITAVPYYYSRRKIVREKLSKLIKNKEVVNVCDFGCGDGQYLKYFSFTDLPKKWYGIDISKSMIEQAKKNCPEALLEVSSNGINNEWNNLDLVYSIAVFAHVLNDDVILALFKNIHNKLSDDGYFIIFEQTGPLRQQGDFWCRRTSNEYSEIAKECGFTVEESSLITYSIHKLFERYIAPVFKRIFVKGKDYSEKSIRANRYYIYRIMSSIMVALSFRKVRKDDNSTYGNTFFIFRKVND
ncbi:methyltransferase domain-containing protein [Polaribacter sp. MSW13]|uniref:Methyltransferase domain-containing protein n=1 Tax=Polaribacter marinus TaxID=2916838 RepID=A0A9X1VKW2_9FLAO|nr:class I SAM-dependent methyltransferase [Polaribacter marinus]MCI2228379.1 methyltransferase domain-containing protein [Polaribacter marinus]